MEKFLVEEGTDLKFDTNPGGPLINDSTCLAMRSEVREFLVGIVERYSIDTVVSMPRKGTWMIDDAVRTFLSPWDIEHLSFGTDFDLSPKARIMIFDDSINTGRGVSRALDWVLKHSPADVVVASLAITDETLRDLRDRYEPSGAHFKPMAVFDPYKDFNAHWGLRPGCQNYYFAMAILPYVYTLNSNRNPGFCNWVVGLDRVDDPDAVFDSIRGYMEGIGGILNPYEKGVAFDSAYHMTFDLMSAARSSSDDVNGFSKVRFSMIEIDGGMELSMAPILCPDIDDDGVPIDDVIMELSTQFVEENRDGILEALEDFKPIDLGTRNLNPVR